MENYNFYQPIDIRYGDLDAQGHVIAARYMTFIEHARIAYLKTLNLWTSNAFLDIGVILAEAQMTYKTPILWGQTVKVGTRIARLGKKSMDMFHSIEDANNGQELALSKTVLVSYDYHADQTIEIPEKWRKQITLFEQLER
jgi:acyl-CoA thioester hydrolase